jgi:hypothetical protein
MAAKMTTKMASKMASKMAAIAKNIHFWGFVIHIIVIFGFTTVKSTKHGVNEWRPGWLS